MGRTLASQDPILDQGQGRTVPALLARKGRGVQAAAARGEPPDPPHSGTRSSPSLCPVDAGDPASARPLGAGRKHPVWWGPPAVVFPACAPGAGNPPASRAPAPSQFQQCASAEKRAWAGLLFRWGFPLLLCGSPPPPAPLAHPWNPGPSRWPPALFLPGCGSSSRDGGVSGPAPLWGHLSRGLAAFLGPASASARAAWAGCPPPGGGDAPELGQG